MDRIVCVFPCKNCFALFSLRRTHLSTIVNKFFGNTLCKIYVYAEGCIKLYIKNMSKGLKFIKLYTVYFYCS